MWFLKKVFFDETFLDEHRQFHTIFDETVPNRTNM